MIEQITFAVQVEGSNQHWLDLQDKNHEIFGIPKLPIFKLKGKKVSKNNKSLNHFSRMKKNHILCKDTVFQQLPRRFPGSRIFKLKETEEYKLWKSVLVVFLEYFFFPEVGIGDI
jgi:hypothetical protein